MCLFLLYFWVQTYVPRNKSSYFEEADVIWHQNIMEKDKFNVIGIEIKNKIVIEIELFIKLKQSRTKS